MALALAGALARTLTLTLFGKWELAPWKQIVLAQVIARAMVRPMIGVMVMVYARTMARARVRVMAIALARAIV